MLTTIRQPLTFWSMRAAHLLKAIDFIFRGKHSRTMKIIYNRIRSKKGMQVTTDNDIYREHMPLSPISSQSGAPLREND